MELTDILIEIPEIGETEEQTNPTAHIKFKNMDGRGEWYVTEMSAIEDKDVLLFGYVKSPLGADCDEWGLFLLSQLLETGVILLDSTFKPTPIKEVIAWTKNT